MGIKGFFIGTKADEEAERRPSRLWEITHPRKLEALWAAEEEKAELQMEAAWREEEADRAYEKYADDCHWDMQKGNPPDSRALDREILQFSAWFPEVSAAERAQAQYFEDMRERGPRMSYSEFEGPGYTEPPIDWEGWHQDHSEYERDFYWETERPELCTAYQLTVAREEWLKTPEGQQDREEEEEYERGLTDPREAVEWDPEPRPERGTNEWSWERGYSDEPDWSHDLAVDPRTGKQFYNDGRVLTWDGRDITDQYRVEPGEL